MEGEKKKLYDKAIYLYTRRDHIKALEILEDWLLVHREDEDSCRFLMLEGDIFVELAEKETDPNVRFAYLLGSVGCYAEDVKFSEYCAPELQKLGKQIGSVMYYKKCLHIAKQSLSYISTKTAFDAVLEVFGLNERKENLVNLIKEVEFKIAVSKTRPLDISEPIFSESKKSPEPSKDKFEGLRSFWAGLDVKIKRDLMKVSIAKLLNFVEGIHQRKGRDALEQVLTSARKDKNWIFWMCRSNCSKKFCSDDECKNHLEQEHDADIKPSSEKEKVQRIGKNWTHKISVGGWEPVDTVAAIEMIANGKTFASKSKNGWSKQWPLVVDDERGKLLKEIKFLLVSLL